MFSLLCRNTRRGNDKARRRTDGLVVKNIQRVKVRQLRRHWLGRPVAQTLTERRVALPLLRKQVLRIFATAIGRAGRARYTLLVGREFAITGIARISALQAVPIRRVGRRYSRRAHVCTARKDWRRDCNKTNNKQSCE